MNEWLRMSGPPIAERRFLFLQGPHGPFFTQLGRMLRAAGAEMHRVGFNAGDRAFWPDRKSFAPYLEHAENWPQAIAALLAQLGITDLVL